MSTTERLTALSAEIARMRTEIRILEEQFVFIQDVAEDARLRAVVSGTPLADREAREAGEDADRTRRLLESAREQLGKLTEEQDRLLERLFDES